MRKYALSVLTVVNFFFFLTIVIAFCVGGGKFQSPWDGPAVVTIVLAAATLVLAAVAIGVALLTIWGYTTLREHAENIATGAARETAEEVANRSMRAWLDRFEISPEGDTSPGRQSVADAYKGDSQ